MTKGDYESANAAMSGLLDLRCWAVAYGPNTWTNMVLELGPMIPRCPLGKHKTNPPSLQYYDSEYSLYVEGPWSLVVLESGTPRTVEHSEDALDLAGRLLTDSTLVSARLLPATGAEFEFSSEATLLVHQRQLIGDSPIETVLSVFFPDNYFVLESDGSIVWHQREANRPQ